MRTLAEDVHWSAIGMDNLAIHFQGFCVCDERCVRVSGHGKARIFLINSDKTVELQTLSKQLYYMLVMMLSDKLWSLFGTLQKELLQKRGASCSGSTNLTLVSGTEQCCSRC